MHIGRTRFSKDIITEFCAPKNKKSGKAIIFCSGVPGSPDKDDVLEFWAKKGYWTFFPRYRGTWESGGKFLTHSPHEDILDVIDDLGNPFLDYWKHKKFRFKPKEINIVASSFGGPAGILASLDERVNKVVCMAPVVDWVKENKAEPLEVLYKLLNDAFGDAYRVSKTSFNKLARGKFYNPVNHIDKLDPNKIMIFHAQNDDIVKYKPVAKFAKKLGCSLVTLKKGGHLSSSLLLTYRHYWRAKRFFNS